MQDEDDVVVYDANLPRKQTRKTSFENKVSPTLKFPLNTTDIKFLLKNDRLTSSDTKASSSYTQMDTRLRSKHKHAEQYDHNSPSPVRKHLRQEEEEEEEVTKKKSFIINYFK